MIDYRARATKAEQENAVLREKLSKKPNFAWFVEQVRSMLKIRADAPFNEIIAKIKVLRDNQELYKEGAAVRKANMDDVERYFNEGVEEGKRIERNRIKNLIGKI